jgi:nanoRNase/pAp phosphatase (c-di-AMP/oligoRNAs hydrolase)
MTLKGKNAKFPFVDLKGLKKVAVVCHRNADADAYLSAFAISKLLGKLAPRCEVTVVTPGGMTLLTTRLSRRFPHKVVETSDEDYDLYVAVDVGDEELLAEWKEKMQKSKGVKVLVDHHPERDTSVYDHVVVDEEATSAAEVVLALFSELGVEVDKETAQALLEGIMFDSSHLSIAGPSGLKAAVTLLDRGADLALARRELRSEPDYSEVLAKLKGAKRLKIYRAGDWVVVSTLVGSFQAHVARALVYLGADVAVAGGESEGETRVSLRSTQRFSEGSGVRLGTQVADVAAKELGGHGGGHATAASFSTMAEEDEATSGAMRILGQALGKELVEVS